VLRGALVVGLAAAQAGFAATFRGPRDRFWQRMTATGLGLGAFSLLTSRAARGTRIGATDIAVGLGSGAGVDWLFGTFPLFVVIGVFVGFALALYAVYLETK